MLSKAPHNEDIWGIYVYLSAFLVLVLNKCEGLASHTGHFTARERACSQHWIGDWTGPGTGLDVV
jgi:hypothetical protein